MLGLGTRTGAPAGDGAAETAAVAAMTARTCSKAVLTTSLQTQVSGPSSSLPKPAN